jgi:hypothetical protein
MFCSFHYNCFKVLEEEALSRRQLIADRQILGRLAKSQQDGILSAAGLLGMVQPGEADLREPCEIWISQYYAFLDGMSFEVYEPYLSQIGGQGMVFGLLNAAVPASPQVKLDIFHILTSMLLALSLSLIVLWLYSEYGLLTAVFALAGAALSSWLVLFGRSLYMSTWAFFLPMLLMMFFLRRSKRWRRQFPLTLGLTACCALCLKCVINGYEFITPTLVMLFMPLVLYSYLDGPGVRKALGGFVAVSLGTCIAVLLSLNILCVQIAAVEGSMESSFKHISFSIQKRTHSDARDFPPEYSASLKVPATRVLSRYVNSPYLDRSKYLNGRTNFMARYIFKVRHSHLIVLFLLASIVVCFRGRCCPSGDLWRRKKALMLVTWISILSPLSWFLIFKGHSFAHLPLDAIVWQMPFTMFGFALCGLALRAGFLDGRD